MCLLPEQTFFFAGLRKPRPHFRSSLVDCEPSDFAGMAEEFADTPAGFIENADPVDSDAADAGSLGRGGDQPLAQFSGAEKDDRAVMGDGSLIVAVASARQRGVGQREQHAAM